MRQIAKCSVGILFLVSPCMYFRFSYQHDFFMLSANAMIDLQDVLTTCSKNDCLLLAWLADLLNTPRVRDLD